MEEYVRVLQLRGDLDARGFNLRPVHVPRFDEIDQHPWEDRVEPYGWRKPGHFDLRVVSPKANVGWVSSRPVGGNDGFLWQGRGLHSVWTAGAFGQFSVLSAAFRPSLALVQNVNFDTGPGSPYDYYGRANLDLPRRFGDEALVMTHPGQSYVEVSTLGATVGASTGNMWWGPATRNSIIMSNNAPGFSHLYLKSTRPFSVGVAHLDAKWFWGNLYESDYFDDNELNDRRFITGLALEIQPHFIPHLFLGATRVFVQATDEEPTRMRDYFIVFQEFLKENLEDSHDDYGFDKNDQMASIFARWLFPESGFEVYGEFARGDHNPNIRHVFVQLKFSSAYTIGMSKVFELGDTRLLHVNAEVTRLEVAKSDIIRGGYTSSLTNFYVNTIVRQGYTHRGQIVGAAIGPGSNSQHIGVDLYTGWGKAGWYGGRAVYDNDLFYAVSGDPTEHQVEFISGLNGVLFKEPFEITADVALRRFMNIYYVRKNDMWNVTARIGVRWSIGGYR